MLIDKIRRDTVNLVDGLADDLDVGHNRILNLLVVHECFIIWKRLKVAAGALDSLGNVAR
jgi:hypothetical protein